MEEYFDVQRNKRKTMKEVAPSSSKHPKLSPNKPQNHLNFNKVLHVAFNSDCSYFACGFTKGFGVYKCDPCQKAFQREISCASILIVEMEGRCDNSFCTLALVGTGLPDAPFPRNTVYIWDQRVDKIVGSKSFSQNIVSVRLRSSRIVIVLKDSISVLHFPTLLLLNEFEALNNQTGLCEISQGLPIVLVYPPSMPGTRLTVRHLNESKLVVNLFGDEKYYIFRFAISMDGRVLATASTQGSLIRILDAENGIVLQEVINEDCQQIYGLTINCDNGLLAVLSEKSTDWSTVHIFRLRLPEKFRDHVIRAASSSIEVGELLEAGELVKKFHLGDKFEYLIGFGEKKTLVAVDLWHGFYQFGAYRWND